MITRWGEMARIYNGYYPLDDRTAMELMTLDRPSTSGERTAMTLYPGGAPVPERSGVEIIGRSFAIAADITIAPDATDGIIYSMGARFGGHALLIQDGTCITSTTGSANTNNASPAASRFPSETTTSDSATSSKAATKPAPRTVPPNCTSTP